MKRTIIHIDEERCDGCGQCVTECHEGALAIIDGKAKLISDVYCDGLGACIGHCPQGALTFETREAAAFDQEAVDRHLAGQGAHAPKEEPASAPAPAPRPCPPAPAPRAGGCPGSAMRSLRPVMAAPVTVGDAPSAPAGSSRLSNWPVQLALVPPHAPYLQGADVLLCADCVPFAVPDFHQRYLAGRVVLVACPKLDNLPAYKEKLEDIFAEARPRSVTVLRMEVPCCGGLAHVAQAAQAAVTPDLPLKVEIIRIR